MDTTVSKRPLVVILQELTKKEVARANNGYVYLQTKEQIEQDIINQQKVSLIHFSKRDKIIAKWAVIRELKLKNNMSFRQIVKFLNKKYKLDISLSSLYNIWKELENNNQKKGEKNG